jgi:hypothetical protein
MVVCAVRYEPVSLLFAQYQGDFRKKQRTGGRKFQKHLQHGHFSNNALIRYQGGTGSANFHNTEEHVNKLGREHLGGWFWSFRGGSGCETL